VFATSSVRRSAAALVLVALLTAPLACSDSTAKPSPTPDTTVGTNGRTMTPDEALVLANLLKKNYDGKGSEFVATIPYGPAATFVLTGSLDYENHWGQATMRGEIPGRPAEETKLFWTLNVVAEEIPGLAAGLEAYGLPAVSLWQRELSKSSAQDIVLAYLLSTAIEQPENPQLLIQGDASYLRDDELAGVAVSVFRFGKTRFWVRKSDGQLLRAEPFLSVIGKNIQIDFSSPGKKELVGPRREETIDIAEVPDALREQLIGRGDGTAGPTAPAAAVETPAVPASSVA
jgi:hypothetical protein